MRLEVAVDDDTVAKITAVSSSADTVLPRPSPGYTELQGVQTTPLEEQA